MDIFPHKSQNALVQEVKKSLLVEEEILNILGDYLRIFKYENSTCCNRNNAYERFSYISYVDIKVACLIDYDNGFNLLQFMS